MHIHREGRRLIFACFLIAIILITLVVVFVPHLNIFHYLFFAGLLIFAFLITSFFRIPHRIFTSNEKEVIAPADGKIVVIEDVFEKEFLKIEGIVIITIPFSSIFIITQIFKKCK